MPDQALAGLPEAAAFVPVLEVWVPGYPVPQGSMRAPAAGVVVPASGRLRPWRNDVTLVCKAAWRRPGPLAGPVGVELGFVLPRPRRLGHPEPVSRRTGDLDKLIRAILDSLVEAKTMIDDAQVVRVAAAKAYGDRPGCSVRVLAAAAPGS